MTEDEKKELFRLADEYWRNAGWRDRLRVLGWQVWITRWWWKTRG